jgi:hypothetical protein
LYELLKQKGLPSDVLFPTVRYIKENTSLLDYNLGNTVNMSPLTYELPDGRQMRIDGETRHHLGRSLFYQEPGRVTLQSMMLKAIKSVDIDLRRELLANIVISGGTSNVSGFD